MADVVSPLAATKRLGFVMQLVLTPFLAAGVWVLMDGIQSVAASVTRAVLAFWMVFFSAFDAVAGIATGVLTRHANSLAGGEKEGVVAAINFLWDDSRLAGGSSILFILGQGSWIVLPSRRPWRSTGRVFVGSSSAPHSCRCSSLVTPALPQSA